MYTPKHNSMSRFLRFLKSQNEPGMKETLLSTNTPNLSDEDSKIPREYYTPRPVPKSFVVGEVRKLSNNSRPPDSLGDRAKVTDPVIARQPEDTVDSSSPATEFRRSIDLPTPLKSQSSDEPGKASPTRRMSAIAIKTSSNRVNDKQHPRPTFDLLLGQQDPTSPYFTRRYFSVPYVADANNASEPPKEVLHHISELDPQAFEIYEAYTHTGKIGLRCLEDTKADFTWISLWPLMNAYILGCVIEESAFADRVMDTLILKLTLSTAPDSKTVEHLFGIGRKGIPEVLKMFVVDCFINAQQQSREILETSNYPASFKEVALQCALRNLSCNQRKAVKQGCEYHIHGEKKACYKTRLTPADTLKEQRLAAVREKFARDAELATANALQNGVKSVDWEQRRLHANQALRRETGQNWTGFRRLENVSSMNQVDLREPSSGQINGQAIGDHNTCGLPHLNSAVPSMNGVMPTYDLNKTPHNSLMLEHRPAKTKSAIVVPVVQTSGNVPPSEPAISLSGFSGQDLHPFLLAELDGNSTTDALHQTRLALEYKPSVDRIRSTYGQTTTTSIMANCTSGVGSNIRNPSHSVSASDRRYIGDLTVEYEKYVDCPGAYPESNTGV